MITFTSTFGASDHPTCPGCSQAMSVVRRSPHASDRGFEAQTVRCQNCGYEISRTVNAAGVVRCDDVKSAENE